jgi:plastocyanin
MSGTLDTPTPEVAPGVTTASPEPVHIRGFGWRRLQAIAAAVTIAAFVMPMAIEGKVEGFLVAMAAPFVIGLVLVRFLPRVAAVFLGVVSAATLASSAPYIVGALAHPESATDFVPQSLFTLSMVIAAVAAVPAYREVSRRDGISRTPGLIAVAAGLVAVVAGAISIAAATGVQSVAAEPGDQTVLTRDFAFAPGDLRAAAGTIAVHVTNEDSTRHTFTIDGLADLSVPPDSTQRVTFEAEPGTYRFYCRPHVPGMEGVLVVE